MDSKKSISSPAEAKSTTENSHWLVDAAIVLALGVLAAIGTFFLSNELDRSVLRYENMDKWFSADVFRALANITQRLSNHMRANVHPLFSLVGLLAVRLINKGLQTDIGTSVRIFYSIVAAMWSGSFFILLRLLKVRQVDAIIFSALLSVTSGAIFWFAVPESYPLGSLSILLCLCILAWAERRTLPGFWYVVSIALTFSVTVTNAMVGVFGALARVGLWKTVRFVAYAFCIIMVLWGVQMGVIRHEKIGYPLAWIFEKDYVLTSKAGGIANVTPAFFFHSVVMPEIHGTVPDSNGLSVQFSRVGTGSSWGLAASIIWAVLLLLGAHAMLRSKEHPTVGKVVALSVAGQFALHVLYGEETFLYSLHYVPLLVLVGAWGTKTRARPIVLGLAAVLAIFLFMNNRYQFAQANAQYQKSERHELLTALRSRPNDPWPRGTEHTILAIPGTKELEKSYHEMGGNFSPTPGSFGISFWVTDNEDNIIQTSDRIPMKEVEQHFVSREGRFLPSIATSTPYYDCSWSVEGPSSWKLDLTSKCSTGNRLLVVLRSVGPAGGPVNHLSWNGSSLVVNDRWWLNVSPGPAEAIDLVDENTPGWIRLHTKDTSWHGSGWGCARFALSGASKVLITINDTQGPKSTPDVAGSVQQGLRVDLPDKQFERSMNAQIAHLLMGLVGDETRPGDPLNYPLEWQRDGAYVVSALVRSGQLGVARKLAASFAEKDFFGGFGPEGDGPGLALWVLGEVSGSLGDSLFDQAMWPHVRRKVDLIDRMIVTKEKIRYPIESPIVPSDRIGVENDLLCYPSQGGLIEGRMDGAPNPLYVSAISYLGLCEAAALARKTGHPDLSSLWLHDAAALKRSWVRAFAIEGTDNERPYINCLWPSWIADSVTLSLEKKLGQMWSRSHTSAGEYRNRMPWTYFEVAEAHQRLYLGELQTAAKTLEFFFQNQTSPGLYSWWEGVGEENSYFQWEHARGWVDPPVVTPHYWTAAEILLLQIDMLAYVEPHGDQKTLVLGGGVPESWISSSMNVEGIRTGVGLVNWSWTKTGMKVHVDGPECRIRLGRSFPAGATIDAKFSRK